jgi:hypothetical protein
VADRCALPVRLCVVPSLPAHVLVGRVWSSSALSSVIPVIPVQCTCEELGAMDVLAQAEELLRQTQALRTRADLTLNAAAYTSAESEVLQPVDDLYR